MSQDIDMLINFFKCIIIIIIGIRIFIWLDKK